MASQAVAGEGLDEGACQRSRLTGLEKLANVSGRSSPARQWSLLWFLVTNIGVLGPLIFLAGQGSWLTWLIAALDFVAAWVAFKQLVDVSKIKKE